MPRYAASRSGNTLSTRRTAPLSTHRRFGERPWCHQRRRLVLQASIGGQCRGHPDARGSPRGGKDAPRVRGGGSRPAPLTAAPQGPHGAWPLHMASKPSRAAYARGPESGRAHPTALRAAFLAKAGRRWRKARRPSLPRAPPLVPTIAGQRAIGGALKKENSDRQSLPDLSLNLCERSPSRETTGTVTGESVVRNSPS
jgi:hypothetical protein